MKPEAQSFAIAEAVGTHKVVRDFRTWNKEPEDCTVIEDSSGRVMLDWGDRQSIQTGFIRIEDYLNDLNAAFPLLHKIDCIAWRIQSSHNGLRGNWVIISRPSSPVASDCVDAILVNGETLSAAICEAFLRAAGKWDESK